MTPPLDLPLGVWWVCSFTTQSLEIATSTSMVDRRDLFPQVCSIADSSVDFSSTAHVKFYLSQLNRFSTTWVTTLRAQSAKKWAFKCKFNLIHLSHFSSIGQHSSFGHLGSCALSNFLQSGPGSTKTILSALGIQQADQLHSVC